MSNKVVVVYLGNRLQGKGRNPTVVDTLGDKLSKDFKIIRASHFVNPLLRILHMWFVVLKNANKANYLLIDTYSTSAFLYAWTCAKLGSMLGLKYIPYLHGGNLPTRYKKSPKICRAFFKNAFQTVAPSGFLKTETQKDFPIEVEVIPNYLEINNYKFTERINADVINLLWVRGFHQIYNPVMAIEVLGMLSEKGHKNCKLTMVGPDNDGSLGLAQEKAKEFEIEGRVTFTGRLKKEDWLELSQSHNIFINTTDIDNTPVSVMEAMSLGLPVVTTNVGGLPYLFENGKEGVQVPPQDVNAMVDAILDLNNNPDKVKKLSNNARTKAETWDWNVVETQWKKLLVRT